MGMAEVHAVLNYRVPEAMSMLYAAEPEKAAAFDKREGRVPPTMRDPTPTCQLLQDLAYLTTTQLCGVHGAAWGYTSAADHRLRNCWSDYRSAEEAKKMAKRTYGSAGTSASGGESKDDKLLGFADESLEAWRTYLGGFCGLITQYQWHVRRVYQRRAPPLFAPTQRALEGAFSLCICCNSRRPFVFALLVQAFSVVFGRKQQEATLPRLTIHVLLLICSI